MRVECHSIDDFIIHLTKAPAVFNNTVFTDITTNPLDGDRRKAAKFSVVFQVSMVVVLTDGAEYLVVAGEDCGVDYHDSSNERSGTARANELLTKVEIVCADRGMLTLPGILNE